MTRQQRPTPLRLLSDVPSLELLWGTGEGSRLKLPLSEWSEQITTQGLRPKVGCKHCAQGKHVVFKHLPLGMGYVIEGMNSDRSPGGQKMIKGKDWDSLH